MSYINKRTLALMNARKIVDFISNLYSFELFEVSSVPVYTHIGALYTDVILQSGLNYEHVVKPRVIRVLQSYPEACTLSLFHALLESEGSATVLQWNHFEKIQRMDRFIHFSMSQGIDSIYDLIHFISIAHNQDKVIELKGIGPKTLDYLMKLLGFDTIAVDRHIYKFVKLAGVTELDYNNTKLTVGFAADLLDLSKKTLDYSIWNYMKRKEYELNPNLQFSFEMA